MILPFLLFAAKGFSTFQVQDYLFFNGDTLYLFNIISSQRYIFSPLEQIDSVPEKIRKYWVKHNDIECISSGCWRGFYAEWKILDNTLFLSNVFECACGTRKNLNAAIEEILGRRFTNGLIKADWVNGIFWWGKEDLFMWDYRIQYKMQIENGKIISVEKFIQEKTDKPNDDCDMDEDKIYNFWEVEIPPLFDDKPSEIGFRDYVLKNIKYPAVAHTPITGRVIVEFIIEKDGSVSNAIVLRSTDPLLDAEALRIINSSPKWTPGKVRGEPVKVRHVFPVIFNLN